MKIETMPYGDVTSLTVYLPIRSYKSRDSELARCQIVGEALARELRRRAEVLGLQPRNGIGEGEPHLGNGAVEATVTFHFYPFTAGKNAKALRTKLLEEMVLFCAMHRDLFVWAGERVSTLTRSVNVNVVQEEVCS